ncbi:hypothetical protein GCM10028808_39680 [Spirosoma migulaei]
MKTITSLTCLFTLLLFAGCADENGTNETPQGLGKALFDALQDDDKMAFDQYVFVDTDRDELLKSVKEDDRLTEQVKSQTQQVLLNFIQIDRPKLEESFAEIRQKALECGLQDWSDAEYVTSTFDQQEVQNLNLADIKAKFRWKGLEYELNIDRCLQTKRGWVFLRKPSLDCRQ